MFRNYMFCKGHVHVLLQCLHLYIHAEIGRKVGGRAGSEVEQSERAQILFLYFADLVCCANTSVVATAKVTWP